MKIINNSAIGRNNSCLHARVTEMLTFRFNDLFISQLFITLITFFVSINSLIAQVERTQNYKRFDEKLIHFGFMLGYNSSSFSALPVQNAYSLYKLKSLGVKAQPGGQVGIVSTLKCGTPVIRLRFIPTLSFQERSIYYTFENPSPPSDPKVNNDIFWDKRVNSTNIDLPLMLQFRTLRLNNFATYILVGGQYTIDLQSQEKAIQNPIDPFVKIKKNDYSAQLGGGFEFFMPYFKLGLEIKYQHGFKDVFIQDNTSVSEPIQLLYNKVWWFSIIFEG